jgi:FAD/FMN-containing dehydrogenase
VTDALASLRAAFSGALLTETADMAPFLTDWRGAWTGTAHAVALPDTTEEVAKLVRWCATQGWAIVPQGGNTGQSGGSVPEPTGDNLVLSLRRLNRIRSIDPANDTISVDAGVILQTVQDTAAAHDRFFPLSLGAEGSCTIGGNLATNAGGTAVLRYGNARDLCLGVEVVLPDGVIWQGMRGLRKDNSGYDLRDLFIGSEGTLGIITGAVLKLFPKPAGRVTALAAVTYPSDAMAAFAAIRASHYHALTAFELMSDFALGLVTTQFPDLALPVATPAPWYLLVEFTDLISEAAAREALEAALATALEDGHIVDATVAASLAQSHSLWQLRERISEASGRTGKIAKHDIAVPVSSIAHFISEAHAAVGDAFPASRPITFGHLGDGNLHFNYLLAEGDDAAALTDIVHHQVRGLGGTISAEHGLGVLRRDEAWADQGPVGRQLMSAVKAALDPQGLMNPAKVLPADHRT